MKQARDAPVDAVLVEGLDKTRKNGTRLASASDGGAAVNDWNAENGTAGASNDQSYGAANGFSRLFGKRNGSGPITAVVSSLDVGMSSAAVPHSVYGLQSSAKGLFSFNRGYRLLNYYQRDRHKRLRTAAMSIASHPTFTSAFSVPPALIPIVMPQPKAKIPYASFVADKVPLALMRAPRQQLSLHMTDFRSSGGRFNAKPQGMFGTFICHYSLKYNCATCRAPKSSISARH